MAGDDSYDLAVTITRAAGKVSASFLQRRLTIGYNAACRIVERMEADGLVGPADASGKRALLGAVTAIAAQPDASELVASIETARALLDAGDVERALKLSSVAYDQAKAGAASADRVKASRELVDKARRMQGEALKIESLCYVAMADAVDDAQAKGQVARQGRKSNAQDAGVFTLEEVGIDSRRLSEARHVRNAVRKEPEFIERVVEARLAEGLEPSRAALKKAAGHAIGTKAATKDERGDQLYETPDVATRSLLALESFTGIVKEPAVGRGAILTVLEEAEYEVIISDLRDRGVATRHGELQQVGDFLQSAPDGTVGYDIVTNPPYGDIANAFLAHALRVHQPRKMAALLNLNFMCGFDDSDRVFLMQENPPSRVYVFSRRLPMMHRDGWDGPKASSQMNTAWFVWERNDDGSYGRGNGAFETIRIDWEHYSKLTPLAPGAGGHVGPMVFDDAEDFTRDTPRKSLEERVGEERARALVWAAERSAPFDGIDLRRGIGVRPSTADALIISLDGDGLISPDVEPGRWAINEDGWLALQATAGALVGQQALNAVDALKEIGHDA